MLKIGRISETVFKRSVIKRIKNRNKDVVLGVGIGRDFSLIKSDSSYIVNGSECIELNDEQSIYLGLHKLANKIYVSGAFLTNFVVDIILPEGFEENELRTIISEIDSIVEELNISISGCNTRVSSALVKPIISVYASGIIKEDEPIYSDRAQAGDDIVVTKWIGLEGTSIIAKKEEATLKNRFSTSFVDSAIDFDRYISIATEARIAKELKVHSMHNASEGGIFAGLWEIAGAAKLGCTVDLLSIPLKQQTVEICEEYGVNPYELLSGGSLIITTANGKDLVSALEDEGISSVVVGKITESNDRLVINGDEKRFLESPRGDEIYKIKK